ncbi:RNA ligase (ATP) [Spirillospora sp. NPDC048911]|uniref:RNA ligase (ATP) n=1 Tax=Spirillospora sp. NPDC048911 TaxID=3364527 RepID=UPI00371C7B9F
MSTLRVTAERLTIHPHDNADALELAQVGLYRAVVAKGQYKTGDWALYIPEGSLLPDALIEELGLTGKLAGSAKNRVKAVRLRGELSQGIVCSPTLVNGADLAAAHAEDRDFAADLGVTKWVPPIPVHMAGEMVAAPDLVPWIDIEDIKRYPALFEPGEPVVATEKIHGTACAFTLTSTDAYVSSKGFSSKRLAIKHDPSNLYWRAVEGHGVPEAAARIADLLSVTRVAIFGEVFGQGVQDLAYGANGKGERPGYAVFDVAVSTDGGRVRWLEPTELTEILATVGLPSVPVLYTGLYEADALMALANGRETVSGKDAHLREGLVVRTASDRYSPITGGRAIGKFVSPAYLTRKGGTEYE